MFTIALGDDQDANLRAAIQFEYFVERLDEADQLDALQALADIYISLHRWNKVDLLAEELGHKASIQYHNQYRTHGRRQLHKEPSRPLFFYVLYAKWLQSAACHERGEYEQALLYTAQYSDTGWIREESEAAQRIKGQFQERAVANTYLHRLMAGQTEVLPEYVEYIAIRENEILPALPTILKAANRYDLNVDEIIARFQSHLDWIEQLYHSGELFTQVNAGKYNPLLCELSSYYLNKGQPEPGIKYTLRALESSVKINNMSNILRCVKGFEEFRHLAGAGEQQIYKDLISQAQEVNPK
jgi:hypothetical protein